MRQIFATKFLQQTINKAPRFNPSSTNFTEWSNKLKQFVGNVSTNCLSMFDHFVGLALKGVRYNFES